jgi:hypothetical protein
MNASGLFPGGAKTTAQDRQAGGGAIVLVLVYGPRNLSRHPRQVLAAASDDSQARVR